MGFGAGGGVGPGLRVGEGVRACVGIGVGVGVGVAVAGAVRVREGVVDGDASPVGSGVVVGVGVGASFAVALAGTWAADGVSSWSSAQAAVRRRVITMNSSRTGFMHLSKWRQCSHQWEPCQFAESAAVCRFRGGPTIYGMST